MTCKAYFDHAATTHVRSSAREAFARGLDGWGNPNSPHAPGRASRALLEEARATIAEVLGWPHEIIFTSGASEALEIAARRALRPGRIHLSTEHPVVHWAMGAGSKPIPVDGEGRIDIEALDALLAQGPALVAIQQVNNETGVIHDLDSLAPRIRAAGSLLLADSVQGASKLPLPDADFIAICGHKIGGPPGVGALLVRDLATLEAVGSGQEKGYRRGTQDVPSALAFAAALAERPWDLDRLAALQSRIEDKVVSLGGVVIGAGAPRVPNISAIAFPGGDSASMLVRLDLEGIAVSAGSACSSGKQKGSAVLAAMGVPAERSAGFLRLSMGPDSSDADVDLLCAGLEKVAPRGSASAAA